MAKVIIDAGHGGMEPGAIYEGREEKNDTLRLALAVGEILKKNGVDVAFTRTEDVYNSPFEKAQIANREGGDFLISIHRNSSPEANQYSGVESLVFDLSGRKVEMAENINAALAREGLKNLGVRGRPNLVVLRRSRMPAVIVEAGFINNDADNALFDQDFEGIAQAIADGIMQTLREEDAPSGNIPQRNDMQESSASHGSTSRGSEMQEDNVVFGGSSQEMRLLTGAEMDEQPSMSASAQAEVPRQQRVYRIQTGAFRIRAYAEELLYQLQRQGFPAFILYQDGLYRVQVGAFRQLDNAVRMEDALRRYGYSTYITT